MNRLLARLFGCGQSTQAPAQPSNTDFSELHQSVLRCDVQMQVMIKLLENNGNLDLKMLNQSQLFIIIERAIEHVATSALVASQIQQYVIDVIALLKDTNFLKSISIPEKPLNFVVENPNSSICVGIENAKEQTLDDNLIKLVKSLACTAQIGGGQSSNTVYSHGRKRRIYVKVNGQFVPAESKTTSRNL